MAFLDENGLTRLWTHICARLKQSDWKMNDESDGAFVKNRTHYYTGSGTTIVPNTAFSISSTSTYTELGEFTAVSNMEMGKRYSIVFDNVEYNITSTSNAIVGNGDFADNDIVLGNTSDYPFAIFIDMTDYLVYAYANKTGNHTLQIFDTPNVVQLDEAFIPDTIARVSDIATTVVATSGNGAAYTATVDGIFTLVEGVHFFMIPNTTSTAVNPTLNVNGLGAKYLRRPLSSSNSLAVQSEKANWLTANSPVEVVYDGIYWVVKDMVRPDMTDAYGTLPVSNGGTGATAKGTTLLSNIGITTGTGNPPSSGTAGTIYIQYTA